MNLSLHHLKHYLTVQNTAIVIAFAIAISWVWGTVTTLQDNFKFQQQVDGLDQELSLMKLQNENLKFQERYYKSPELFEIRARQRLGKAAPGEHLVILPSSTDIKDTARIETKKVVEASNFSQWMSFFFSQKR